MRILRCRDQEALDLMEKIYQQVVYCVENFLDQFPSNEVLLNLAKNYIELEVFVKAIRVLDLLVKLDDESVFDYLFRMRVGIY